MSDFFSNLASRTADAVPPVLPRVASLFETEPSDEAAEQHAAATALLVPARWTVAPTMAQPAGTVAPLAQPSAIAQPALPAAATPLPTAPHLTSVSPEPANAMERRLPQQVTLDVAQQPIPSLIAPEQAASFLALPSAPEQAANLLAIPSEAARERTPLPAAPVPPPNPDSLPEARPNMPPSSIAFVQPSGLPTATPSFMPQAAPLANSAPPQPIIHVSIGRVEVRAAPQTPTRPPAESRTRPTVMSLDEYLRSSEGRR